MKCSHFSCRMLSGLPTELIIMSCQYLSFKDVDELAYTTKRMMQIVKRNVPLALQPRIEMKNMAIYPSLKKRDNIRFFVEWKKMAELRKSSRNTDDHIEIILKPKIDDGDLKIYEAFLDYYRYLCVERDYVSGNRLNWEEFAVQRAGLVDKKELRIQDDIDWYLTDMLSTVRAAFVEKKLKFGKRPNAIMLDAADEKRIQETKFIQNDIVEVECKATAQVLSDLFQMRYFSNADLVREPPFKPRCWTLLSVKTEEKSVNWKDVEAILETSTDVSSWREQPVRGWDKKYKIRSNGQTWNLHIRPMRMKIWVKLFAPPSGNYIDIKIN
ncbi:hypothetical protein WR25_20481 [Diploscapter pachys]|uniref:F-box domain-containing protein n=1 Tax=Diploscapter pachys TaxID=2018661 RepID=A0A2A2JRR1_9BILA|nr:hypothetical protein WR25_20481 [Diploscapter pachys]